MADEDFKVLEFADGPRGVDQPYAGWIEGATEGNTKAVTFDQAMKLINDKPLRSILQGIERQVYVSHFSNLRRGE